MALNVTDLRSTHPNPEPENMRDRGHALPRTLSGHRFHFSDNSIHDF